VQSAPVEAGQVLAGKYRVERVLGEGGMGIVVEAMDMGLERRVAIKFLLPDFARNEEAVQRFLREARAAVKIQSEHVARVIDVNKLENGAPYMVMEFLEGSDLSQVIETTGPLPVEEAALYVIQACEALAEAHAYGIVHRDLKPANLFLSTRTDGTRHVKVLDFGVSKSLLNTSGQFALTDTSMMVGSPLYIEVHRGGETSVCQGSP
jgi:serine/threonine-protein kinase